MVRREDIKEHLDKDYKLLKRLEDKLRIEIDPRLELRWTEDINKVKQRIHQFEEELRSLSASPVQPKPVTSELEQKSSTSKSSEVISSPVPNTLLPKIGILSSKVARRSVLLGGIALSLALIFSTVKDSPKALKDNSNAVIRNDQGDDLNTNGDDQAAGTVFRLLNPQVGVYFYTTDIAERDAFIASGNYQSDGASFTSVNPNVENAQEVYRFFNSSTGIHLYTVSENERDFIRDNLSEFTFEGEAFNVYKTEVEGSIPVYRLFNPYLGVHFYTPSTAERDFFAKNLSNYELEGIAYYALPLEE
ncbi:MAG: hypothetical protein AAGE84_23920 [Cyanobacteria bacterium P01_G01_bin.39]